ncbi:MAG: FkbM family methyltransferase [Candidatus Binataceae bacterium]
MEILGGIIAHLPRGLLEAASNAQWRNPLFKRAFDTVADRFKNRDGIIQRGVGKGLRFNPGRSDGGYLLGTTEPGVQMALQLLLRPGMSFYDLGANVGFHSMIAARLIGPSQGDVVSFEPVEENARQLRHNIELNGFRRVVVRQEALADVDEEEGRFLISDEPTFGMLASTGKEPTRCIGSIKVKVRRLDDVVARNALPAPDVIKIDVEGAEVDVLRGGGEVLRKYRPVLLMELHGTNHDIADLLGAADYTIAVLGSSATVTESPWDAYIVAVPAEKKRQTNGLLDQLRNPEFKHR